MIFVPHGLLWNSQKQHPQPSVRQSSYALVGDMAVQCFGLLQPYMPNIMPFIVSQLYPDPKPEEVSACNNAAWCVGEIALRYGASACIHTMKIDFLNS